MGNVTLPNNIVNGQQADATSVMANFNAIVNDYNGNVSNVNVSNLAAIAYQKLNLSGGILNSDINASASIAYSKLNLNNSILNADIGASAAIADSKLAKITTVNKVALAAVDPTGITNGYVLINNAGVISGQAPASVVVAATKAAEEISTNSSYADTGCIVNSVVISTGTYLSLIQVDLKTSGTGSAASAQLILSSTNLYTINTISTTATDYTTFLYPITLTNVNAGTYTAKIQYKTQAPGNTAYIRNMIFSFSGVVNSLIL